MMTIEAIKGMTSNVLISQYEAAVECMETAWDNANDGSGDYGQHQHDLDIYNEAKADSKSLEAEIKARKANGTLYDGRRGEIVKIWNWAKAKCNAVDEEHLYNIVRKVAEKSGIVMLHYYNNILA